jgi:hypothetical protein
VGSRACTRTKNKSEPRPCFYWFLHRASSLELRPVGRCRGRQGGLTAPPWGFLVILCRQAASGGGDLLGGVAALGRDDGPVVGIANGNTLTTDSSRTRSEPGCSEPDSWIDGRS